MDKSIMLKKKAQCRLPIYFDHRRQAQENPNPLQAYDVAFNAASMGPEYLELTWEKAGRPLADMILVHDENTNNWSVDSIHGYKPGLGRWIYLEAIRYLRHIYGPEITLESDSSVSLGDARAWERIHHNELPEYDVTPEKRDRDYVMLNDMTPDYYDAVNQQQEFYQKLRQKKQIKDLGSRGKFLMTPWAKNRYKFEPKQMTQLDLPFKQAQTNDPEALKEEFRALMFTAIKCGTNL